MKSLLLSLFVVALLLATPGFADAKPARVVVRGGRAAVVVKQRRAAVVVKKQRAVVVRGGRAAVRVRIR